MATILHPDGTQEDVQPVNGYNFELEQLHAIVGGFIEIVHVKDSTDILVINEEGKLKDLPRNEQATAIAKLLTKEQKVEMAKQAQSLGANVIVFGPEEDDWIAGPALRCKDEEVR